MRLRLVDLSLHILRVTGSLGAMMIASTWSTWLAAPFAISAFLAAFALMHDLVHGALGLPQRVNRLALSFAGALMLMSGHALRRLHFVHHARPLSDDDVEGRPARVSFLRAIFEAPRDAVRHARESYRVAKGDERSFIVVEHGLSAIVAFALLLSGVPALLLYLAVAVGLRLFMGVWAGHIPHRAPEWLIAVARRLAFSRSPVVLSLLHHELHHKRPNVPCQRLAALARQSA